MTQLMEGLKLKAVFWSEGAWTVGKEYSSRGRVESITVSMQPGQMSMVPWTEIKFTTGPSQLVNCALMEGCELL